jgi:biopolymer transport protein ExbD
MNFFQTHNRKPEIIVVPLVDIILMLVIFFSISTTFVFQPGLLVKLPKSSTAETSNSQTAELMITAQGELYFERLRASMNELEAQMKQYPDKRILIIKADKSVSHGLVVEAMDHAKRAGFERLVIGTHPEIPVTRP